MHLYVNLYVLLLFVIKKVTAGFLVRPYNIIGLTPKSMQCSQQLGFLNLSINILLDSVNIILNPKDHMISFSYMFFYSLWKGKGNGIGFRERGTGNGGGFRNNGEPLTDQTASSPCEPGLRR